MSDDDWRSWKNGKHDNRYHGVKRHSGQRGYKTPVIASIIVAVVIAGYFVYQNYGSPQAVQNEANKLITNASNAVQQISSQSQQSISNLQTTVTSTNEHVPIAVYDNCSSMIRNDLKEISTSCGSKNFLFVLPSAIGQNLQPSEAIMYVSTKVYQYGTNDFTIWLSDQTGGRNYTISLSPLPTSSGPTFFTLKYSASHNFVQTTNILTTKVFSTVIPWSYSVVIKDWNGIVMKDETFTANESNGVDEQNFDLTGIHEPASLAIFVNGNQIYTAYMGSPFSNSHNPP